MWLNSWMKGTADMQYRLNHWMQARVATNCWLQGRVDTIGWMDGVVKQLLQLDVLVQPF